MMPFLAQLDSSQFQGSTSWWQTMGGLLVVFGLLFLTLKLLGKYSNSRSSAHQASILAVWNLGPKREIQVLKLGDEVHYIYRHDGAMVPLKVQSLVDWERDLAEVGETKAKEPEGWKRFFPGGLSLSNPRTTTR